MATHDDPFRPDDPAAGALDDYLDELDVDVQLKLIDRVWRRDGDLDSLIAWLHQFGPLPHLHRLKDLTDCVLDEGESSVDAHWLDQQRRRHQSAPYPLPFGGGGDPLHLSLHYEGPIVGDDDWQWPDSPAKGVAAFEPSASTRTAMLITTSMQGWYRQLLEHGSSLTSDGRGWVVEVIVKPVGWLGSYRRSPTTGVWHATSERCHLMGQ